MKRLRPLVAAIVMGPLIVGCGGGPEIGPPAEVKGGQTDEFKAMMEKAKYKMARKGRGKASPGAAKKGP